MAKITMTEQPQFDVLPPDSVVKVKVDEVKIEDLEGKWGPWQKMRVKFEILDVPDAAYGELIGQALWGSIPFKLTDSPDNQLRQWVEAILGFPLSVGFELDTDDLEGKRCRAIISNYMKKVGTVEQPRHQVESLLPWIAGDTTDSKPKTADPWTTPAGNQPNSLDDPWGAPSASQEPAFSVSQPAPAAQPASAPRVEEEIPF